MAGILYLVPNTLGQPDPLAPDPLGTLIPTEVQTITRGIDYFIAENAKTTRAFLKLLAQQHPLSKPLQEIEIAELNVNTDAGRLPALLEPVLAGRNGGLISEAGVPAVADPGAQLVRLAHDHDVRVRPLVGPSSLLLALMASGLNGQSFAFHGYLPTDPALRIKRIRALEEHSRQHMQTQLFIETPYRNNALLEAFAATCHPQTLLCTATDLTLGAESVRTQTAAKWKSDLASGRIPDIHKKPTVFLMLAA
jgi:16S rRNA (cytidine1402-2'-O)-methyltransferase